MKKNAMGLHLDYDIKMGVGCGGSQPLSTVVMQGDYCIPLIALGAAALVCVGLCAVKCICFHTKYKKR